MAPRPAAGFFILAALAGGSAGCSVVGSQLLDMDYASFAEPGGGVGCRSALGSYALPKGIVEVIVTNAGSGAFNVIEVKGPTRVPDNRHIYCLDHLSLATASDDVRVSKTTAEANKSVGTPFLQLVASKAVDESATIIRTLIRIAFTLISNNPEFASARDITLGLRENPIVLADLRFDPFDAKELAEVNASIRKLGFCLALEDFSYDVAATTPDGYCSNPQNVEAQHPSPKLRIVAEQQRYFGQKQTSGIFFRPRVPYQLSVHVKSDPKGPGRWRLAQSFTLELENISPVVSVGIGRAAFTTRRTALVFDDGVLTDVCVSKGSEIEGFIDIPLDVVYGIIALPSQTIQAAINSSRTRRELIVAQNDLIKAQKAYIDFLNNPNASSPGVTGTAADLNLDSGTGIGVPKPATIVPTFSPRISDAKDAEKITANTTLNAICDLSGVARTVSGGTGIFAVGDF